MKSPKEKYQSDPAYRNLVNVLEGLIEEAKFTPSELREACLLASINYEMRHIREMRVSREVEGAIATLERFISKQTNQVVEEMRRGS